MLFVKKKMAKAVMQEEATKIPSTGKQGGLRKKTEQVDEKYMGDFGTMDIPKPKEEASVQELAIAPGNKRKTKARKIGRASCRERV